MLYALFSVVIAVAATAVVACGMHLWYRRNEEDPPPRRDTWTFRIFHFLLMFVPTLALARSDMLIALLLPVTLVIIELVMFASPAERRVRRMHPTTAKLFGGLIALCVAPVVLLLLMRIEMTVNEGRFTGTWRLVSGLSRQDDTAPNRHDAYLQLEENGTASFTFSGGGGFGSLQDGVVGEWQMAGPLRADLHIFTASGESIGHTIVLTLDETQMTVRDGNNKLSFEHLDFIPG